MEATFSSCIQKSEKVTINRLGKQRYWHAVISFINVLPGKIYFRRIHQLPEWWNSLTHAGRFSKIQRWKRRDSCIVMAGIGHGVRVSITCAEHDIGHIDWISYNDYYQCKRDGYEVIHNRQHSKVWWRWYWTCWNINHYCKKNPSPSCNTDLFML